MHFFLKYNNTKEDEGVDLYLRCADQTGFWFACG